MKKRETAYIPACIGLIMDGNRRWAKERGKSTLEGHRAGYQKLKEVLPWVKEAGVKNTIVFALSTENWQRSQDEISYLLELFRTMLQNELDEIAKENVRLIFAGDLNRFPEDIRRDMRRAMERTKDNTPYTLVVAASYGGRAEILHAANALLAKGVQTITEEHFSEALWTAGVPDPDMVIRTGGAMRLSGFLPWQSVYSELFFTETYWPDFSREEFERVLGEFANRERRRGK